VPFTTMQRWMVIAVLGLGSLMVTVHSVPAVAQAEGNTEELSRKAKTKVAPVYPEIARRLSITGTVKLAIVVSPNGTVKSSKAVGGHPILVNAAMDAVRQWKFEAAPTESSGIVEFKFRPQE
jgi:TonB family protein